MPELSSVKPEAHAEQRESPAVAQVSAETQPETGVHALQSDAPLASTQR